MHTLIVHPAPGSDPVEVFGSWAPPWRLGIDLVDEFLEPVEQLAERDATQRGHPIRRCRSMVVHQERAVSGHSGGDQTETVHAQQRKQFGLPNTQIRGNSNGDGGVRHPKPVEPAA
jgi:hypothetical protein